MNQSTTKITPYFSDRDMPDAKSEYVCWIDMMGTQQKMIDTVRKATIHVFKFHSALIKYKTDDVEIYPLMDGAYITSRDFLKMLSYLQNVFVCLANLAAETREPEHRFLVRAGMAYGQMLHGAEITNKASTELDQNRNITNQIMVGPPMSWAYQIENQAPPFGICIHDSVRLYSIRDMKPTKSIDKWWKWWKPFYEIVSPLIDFGDPKIFDHLKSAIKSYFDYAEKNTYFLSYSKTEINKHRDMFNEYFQ